MVGQTNLLKKLKNYSISTLPHSILLLGERGSEEDLVLEFISNTFNLPLYNITDTISSETIDDIYDSKDFGLYVINITDSFDTKKQNTILKFFEEPNAFTYIVIVGENDTSIIDTIKTRSYVLRLDGYSREQLKTLTNDELTLKVCSTPGQVEVASHYDMSALYDLCNKIVDMIDRASYPNALTISNKVNFKDEYSKYDLYLFIKVLKYVLWEKESIEAYRSLLQLSTHIFTDTYKQLSLEHFITELWVNSRA